jgi:two-component system, OmpR family, sensor kinase
VGQQRLRARLTLVIGVLGASMAVPVAWYIEHEQAKCVESGERTNAVRWMAGTAARADLGSGLRQANTWLVDAEEHVTELGPHEFELATTSLAANARARGTVVAERWEDDDHYLAVAQALPGHRVVLGAWPIAKADRRVAHFRWLVDGIATGTIMLLVSVVWLVTGAALGPVRRAQQLQRDFLAHAAHELRTPLAVMQSSVSHALSRPRTREEYLASLTEVRVAVENTSRCVTQFLDLARFDTGSVELDRFPVRLDLLAEEVVATSAAGGARVRLSCAAPAVVDVDDGLLRQALDNVVRNAVQRAEEATVAVHVGAGEAVVSVTDNGPGFDPNLLPHVFRRFARGDAGGCGLGLALVDVIVSLHQGRAEAVNRSVGGAEVRVILPLSSA